LVPAAAEQILSRYVGFGIWVRKNVTAILWEMERPLR